MSGNIDDLVTYRNCTAPSLSAGGNEGLLVLHLRCMKKELQTQNHLPLVTKGQLDEIRIFIREKQLI
ncbi:MAG: hypothetical protein C0397_06555 [Odoribacter sp.]|nr:hypothetical protein [Odoribacter sp.]